MPDSQTVDDSGAHNQNVSAIVGFLRPMAKPAGSYRHGDLKNALVAAARETIRQREGADFTMREIASLTGVRHAAVYRHYPSKEALLAEIVKLECVALRERIEQAHREISDDQAIGAVIDAYLAFALERAGEYRLLMHIRNCGDDVNRQFMQALATPIERARQTGALTRCGETDSLALLLWAQLHGLAMLALSACMNRSAREQASSELRMLWR